MKKRFRREEIDKLSDKDLNKKLDTITVFARVSLIIN